MPVTLTITITPDRTLWVTMHGADGAQSPPLRIAADQDRRLGAFVDTAQAFARAKLAAFESATIERAGDGDEAIAVEIVEGK
jgi:hypothetical protein